MAVYKLHKLATVTTKKTNLQRHISQEFDIHWSVGTGHIPGARSRQCMWHE